LTAFSEFDKTCLLLLTCLIPGCHIKNKAVFFIEFVAQSKQGTTVTWQISGRYRSWF
jgi:hypothetical protein